jgi:predicted acyl esterase
MQTTGQAAAKWCPYGLVPDQPMDQRMDEGGQLVFDSRPLAQDLDALGFPELELEIAADQPHAFVAATLCEIMPDGGVTRVSYGLLNLTHRDGHENPKALTPGKAVKRACS